MLVFYADVILRRHRLTYLPQTDALPTDREQARSSVSRAGYWRWPALSPASAAEGSDSPRAKGGDGCRERAAAPVGINVVDAGVLPTVYFSMEKNIGRVTVEMATPVDRATAYRRGLC